MRKPLQKRSPLSRERVLQAAVAIVDKEGLAAISMRRLGEELGVEAMSLYNHVASKAAILDGVIEVILGELPAPRRSASWRLACRERARALRAVMRAHPNALPLFVTRPAVTPVALGHVEYTLDLLRRGGFSPDVALGAMQAMVAYVVGHAMASYAAQPTDEESVPQYDRLDEKEFPRVREAARLLPRHDLEAEFELGLEAMLAGLELRLTTKH
jgi:TetR/AcrR family transcriptional regulator, tetracycline repressor protein